MRFHRSTTVDDYARQKVYYHHIAAAAAAAAAAVAFLVALFLFRFFSGHQEHELVYTTVRRR